MGNSVPIIKKYYQNIVVESEDVQSYWEIIPESVRKQREEEARKRDEEERIEAELQSNCGMAIRNEEGKWTPCMDENASEPERFFESHF